MATAKVQINARVDQAVYDALSARKDADRLSLSAVVDAALRKHLGLKGGTK